MKILRLLCVLLCAHITAIAAPGDTTWVSSHDSTQLTYYGNFDAPAAFPAPGQSWRRVYMYFTLGRYACPGYNPQNPGEGSGQTGWCGDWDYTVQTFLMTPTGDTLELGRLITPYANSYYNAAATPANWSRVYTFDVTDYYPLLQNNADIRIHYSGYSGGFTGTVRFAMIEGTPERNVLAVRRIYGGSFPYGNAANPIENYLPVVNSPMPPGAVAAKLNLNITGHGSDNTGCAEFCAKSFTVVDNGVTHGPYQIWRNDCGANELYPQSGTWIYDRGNWCPGAAVRTNQIPLDNFGSSMGSNTIDLNLEAYTGNGSASYIIEANVVYYGAYNHALDVSLEDIAAPTNNPNHYRQGNACGNPKVQIRNSGSSMVDSVRFEYGVVGHTMHNYTQTFPFALGNMPVQVELPHIPELEEATGTNQFVVRAIAVNGQADGDSTNNILWSTFTAPPKYAQNIVIRLRTNSGAVLSGSETSWRIFDVNDQIVASRTGAATNTLYVDTVSLLPGNCYRLVVQDAGCDGLSFWANSDGAGYIKVSPLTGLAYNIERYRNADFGCGFTQWFTTQGTSGVDATNVAQTLMVYPNPAHDMLTVDLSEMAGAGGMLELYDATGRKLHSQRANHPQERITLQGIAPGVYLLHYTADGQGVRTARVVIQ